MKLKENQKLSLQDLASFFSVTVGVVRHNKQKYFEMLEEYADYEVITSPKGRFKHINILAVYDDTYYKSYKEDFVHWLSTEDVFVLTGEGGYSNLIVVTNYYCNINDIPYDGPHYVYETFKGHTDDGKRKIAENKKVPNEAFRTWHYLYHLAKRECKRLGIVVEDREPTEMRSGDFNPIYLEIMTPEQQDKYNAIYISIYGKRAVGAGMEIAEFIEDIDVEEMSAEEMKQYILKQEIVKTLTDKEKRALFYKRLQEAGLLKYRGWPWSKPTLNH